MTMSEQTPEPVEVEAPTLEDRIADLETRVAAVEEPAPEPEAPDSDNADG
jgi:hypothetical protein